MRPTNAPDNFYRKKGFYARRFRCVGSPLGKKVSHFVWCLALVWVKHKKLKAPQSMYLHAQSSTSLIFCNQPVNVLLPTVHDVTLKYQSRKQAWLLYIKQHFHKCLIFSVMYYIVRWVASEPARNRQWACETIKLVSDQISSCISKHNSLHIFLIIPCFKKIQSLVVIFMSRISTSERWCTVCTSCARD